MHPTKNGGITKGFPEAITAAFPQATVQTCIVHLVRHSLNFVRRENSPPDCFLILLTWKDRKAVAADLRQIYQAPTTDQAAVALDAFEAYGVKYDRAVKCLTKDHADLLAFYDFPAEHWKHIRTTNPIESTFATVRHRTTRTKGCLSRQTALTMTHQLMLSAKKKWRKRDGQNRLPEIIQGVEFRDGIKHEIKAA